MAVKFTLFLFGLVILASTNYAAPIPFDKIVEVLEAQFYILERVELLKPAIEETSEQATQVFEKGLEIIEAVTKDPKVIEVKSEYMEHILKGLRKFLEYIGKQKINVQKEKRVLLHSSVFDTFIEYNEDKPSWIGSEELIIRKSFEDNGLTDYINDIHKYFEVLSKKYSAAIEQYLNGLNETEKKDEENLIEWYNKFKAEDGLQKKFEMIFRN